MNWSYPLENETKVVVSFEDKLVRWEIDIIENPDRHFKAEDNRRFGVYQTYNQTFGKFIEKPKLDLLPDNLYNEIVKYITENFTEEDFQESNKQYLELNPSFWIPVNEMIYQYKTSLKKEQYFLMDNYVLVLIFDYTDPLEKNYHRKKYTFEEIKAEPEKFPKEVVARVS
ncbi:MAG: hypothetical protein Q9M91_03645 [Candidatus Dojkabacteria bacterium]|nr:hypothetical protein [Candidatus Dojkabacteria bacterium]MDQ7020910.1 hypothetical protein [Candidatus Dojkabacteria bacterium]